MDSHAKLQLLEGDQVIGILSEEAFADQYNQLFGNCPYKTIFQSLEFVNSWYTAQIKEFHPVAILEFEQDKLKAALWLAIGKNKQGKHKKRKAKLIGAGEYDAEYQTWLVESGYEGIFLPLAFKALFEKFPKSKIIFRFVPHIESLEWIQSDNYWQKFTVIQPYHRPLLQMNHPDYKEVYKKRHLKAKYNRFSKAGHMELVEVKELDHFIHIYDKIMLLLDFRQGALFNKIPSQDNPNRKNLFVTLFKQNLLHVSVLTLDHDITSCIIGMKDGTWMHLAGLITYSPFYGKLSPGLVHIYVLGKLLEEEGYQYFDLTPGDDGYKERMASNADEVYELTVTQDTRFKLKRSLRKYFHELLLSRGIRPMSFNLALQRKKYHLSFKLRNLKNQLFKPRKTVVTKTTDVNESLELPVLEKNKIEHLLMYQESNGNSRWSFLEDAFTRIQEGEKFFSSIHDGKLIYCQWFSESETSPLITSTYVHPEWKNEELNFDSKVPKKDF